MAYFNGKKDFVLVSTKDDTDIINLKKRISVAETAEEMSTILSGATNDSVGSYYQYIGATNETYKKGATYRLAKDGSNQIVFEEIFEQGSSNVQVDTSLTKYGWAADAGIVGAKFNTKVNNTDIVNNLGTNDASKVLSAAQGVELSTRISTVGNNLHTTQQDLATLTQRVDNLPSGGSNIQLDPYLTDATKAAQAKAVGDKFNVQEGNINALAGRAYNLEGRASALEAADTGIKARLDALEKGGGSTGGGSTSLPPYFLNNANVCEEVTAALEDFIARGTPIVYNHEGDNCTLVAYEDSLSACYFVVPNGKKLLKVDLSSGAEFVVTEMDFCNLDGNHGGGGGGGIIDVLELPTTNINENALYRITTANLYYNKYLNGTTNIVNGLPSTGDAFTTDFQTISVTYYNVADNTLYCYVPSYIGSMAGIPAGWYPASTLTAVLGYSWGGLVTSLTDMVKEDTFYLLVLNPLYFYKNGKWVEVPTEGSALTLKSITVSSFQEMVEFCGGHTVYRIQPYVRYSTSNGSGSVCAINSSVVGVVEKFYTAEGYKLTLDVEFFVSSFRRFAIYFEVMYDQSGNLIGVETQGTVEGYAYTSSGGTLVVSRIEFENITQFELEGTIEILYFS